MAMVHGRDRHLIRLSPDHGLGADPGDDSNEENNDGSKKWEVSFVVIFNNQGRAAPPDYAPKNKRCRWTTPRVDHANRAIDRIIHLVRNNDPRAWVGQTKLTKAYRRLHWEAQSINRPNRTSKWGGSRWIQMAAATWLIVLGYKPARGRFEAKRRHGRHHGHGTSRRRH